MDKRQAKKRNKLKILLEGLRSRCDQAKDRISEFGRRLTKTIEAEEHKRSKKKKGVNPGRFTDKQNNICFVDCGSQKVKKKGGRIPI